MAALYQVIPFPIAAGRLGRIVCAGVFLLLTVASGFTAAGFIMRRHGKLVGASSFAGT
jgi:hypothetical protein